MTNLKISRYLGAEKVDFRLFINVWKLQYASEADEGWLVLHWYVFVSSSLHPVDRVYLVQVEHYYSGSSIDRALEDSLLFAEETMNTMMHSIVESV